MSTGESEETCHLLEGFVDYLAQILLLVVALIGLWYKRVVENPRRPVKIWGLDVSKQLFSGLAAHLCNMLIATIVSLDAKNTSPCSWYFVVFTIDTVIGVLLTILLHRLVLYLLKIHISRRYVRIPSDADQSKPKTWAEYIVQCGDYGDPPSLRAWTPQMIEWVLVTVISHAVCGVAIFLLRSFVLVDIASGIDDLFDGHPHLLLFAVMVICPVGMNLIQAWIQDNILKWKQRRMESNKETEFSRRQTSMESA